MQLIGVLCIILWSGGFSAIFFSIAQYWKVFRLSEKDEFIGGDLHYFGPLELDIPVELLDLKAGVMHVLSPSSSPKKRKYEREVNEEGIQLIPYEPFDEAKFELITPARSGVHEELA